MDTFDFDHVPVIQGPRLLPAGNPTSCFLLSLCLYTDHVNYDNSTISQQSKRDPIGADIDRSSMIPFVNI